MFIVKKVRLEKINPFDLFVINDKTYLKYNKKIDFNMVMHSAHIKEKDSVYGVDINTRRIIRFNKYDIVNIKIYK